MGEIPVVSILCLLECQSRLFALLCSSNVSWCRKLSMAHTQRDSESQRQTNRSRLIQLLQHTQNHSDRLREMHSHPGRSLHLFHIYYPVIPQRPSRNNNLFRPHSDILGNIWSSLYGPFQNKIFNKNKKLLRVGRVKIYRVPGPGPSTGGQGLFFEKYQGAETFFTTKFENPRFHFSKKRHF